MGAPPARAFAPVLEQLAGDVLVVAAIDVDDNRATADRYGVMAIPTSILFVDGEEQRRLAGGRSGARLVDELTDCLAVR